jgi:spermidine synthase
VTRPWKTVDSAESDEGLLELRQRGDAEFLIMLAGRVLMNSAASRSEVVLARAACAQIAGREAPRVLVGGLGMGCTLRAALDALPEDARVVVAELNETVLHWCRGPLAALTECAVEDPRVEVKIGDVAKVISKVSAKVGAEAAASAAPLYDAILLDLYEGPHPATQSRDHPHYGDPALVRTRKALTSAPGRAGVLAIWSEDPDEAFEERLARVGFAVRRQRPGRGGRRHVVYLASAS